MGNTESSSNNDGSSNNNNNNNKRDEGSPSSALELGAAVAGTALLAFGAYSLASSLPSPSDNGDNGRRRATQMHSVEHQAGSSFFQNPYGGNKSELSDSDNGDNDWRRVTQKQIVRLEGAGWRPRPNPWNPISYGDSKSSESESESSDSDNGGNDWRRATQKQIVRLEGGGRRYRPNPRNPISYGGDTNEHSALRTIKIMSYNVWGLEVEDFQINKRMEAIGGLIEQHTPDIIFLQEMTPSIYCVFESCDWWQLYECSVPPEKATRRYFCMQLSKLPVKKFYCESFDNSTTGRGLCIAEIDAGANTKLIAATCHLPRPDDSHKNSEERVSQANEALSYLSKFPNVVFGGDMNWNESSDGPFPLFGCFGEWRDAWSVLRPGKDGYTYDTNSNPMLKHNRSLQRRLDRFIYKLKDFNVKKIDMIGTKAIQGIYRHHNGQTLPILPSDHYGLILTICPKQIMQ